MGSLSNGDVLEHRFVIEREVAAGGMGRVYRARDLQYGRPVAVKVLGYRDPKARDRFLQEAVMLAEIHHPGIVRYVAHGLMSDGDPYLAMEWLAGEDLAAHLLRVYRESAGESAPLPPPPTTYGGEDDENTWVASPPSARLSVAQTLQIGRRLASAVAELHKRNFVHRDIKPANLFLADGSLDLIKLIDFGTLRNQVTGGNRTEPGRRIGTPFYMSPEQARSDTFVGPATDVWSIGCVLYECLTGHKAFWADSVIVVFANILMDSPAPISELRPDIPESFASLVMKTLSNDPDDRPPDGHALARALDDLGPIVGNADTLPETLVEAKELTKARSRAITNPAITEVERRVTCLLFAGHADPDSKDTTSADYKHLAEIVAPFGAELQRLANGKLLVSIPGPRTPVDQAGRAARAALALREAAPALSMVLATGRIEGSYQLPQVRVLTRAARALAGQKPGTIRLDTLTATLLDSRFHLDPGPVTTYLVKERSHESTRTLLGKPTRWIGRRRELETLVATFAECSEEEVARAVLITAPAGMGKSRLRYEFESLLRERGYRFEVLRGQGDAIAAGSPFILLTPAIRHLMGIRDGEAPEEQREKLCERVRRVLPPESQQRVATFLGEMIGVPFSDEQDESLRAARGDAMLRSQQMQDAWIEWLAAEAARQPVLMVLEDIHWGDLPSTQYVDSALRSLREAPLMVLALARPEVKSSFPNLWKQRAVSEIPLHALPPKACVRLIRDALGDQATDSVTDAILERAGGNAFYLEELIRAVADSHDSDLSELPDTIVGMVQARLDTLGYEAKRVLRAASIFGEVFWKGGVEALLGSGGAYEVSEWLDDLVETELIIPRAESRLPNEREYAFRHALVRDGAYAMLTAIDRRLGHALAGDWLESHGERDHLVLGEHFLRGGDADSAIPYFHRAAEQALASTDLNAAIKRAEQAVVAGAQDAMRGALRSLQAVASYWLSGYEQSHRYGAEAAALLPEGSAEWFAAVGSALVSSARLGDDEQVAAYFDMALGATCQPDAEAAQLVCLCRGTFQLIFHGHLERADQVLPRIHSLAAEADERDALDALTQAQVYHVQSVRAAQRGDPSAYLPLLESAVAAFERAGDTRNVALERTTVAWSWAEVGELERAADLCEQNLRACQETGNQQAATYAQVNLGYILYQIEGRRAQARQLLEDAIATCNAVGNSRLEGWAHAHLTWLDHHQGDHEREADHAARAVDLLAVTPGLQAWALATHARALLALGQPDEALAKARAAMDILDQLGGLIQGMSLPPLVLARALKATGSEDDAHAAIADAAKRLQARAARFTNPAWKARFLALDDHRQTLDLAKEWLGEDAAAIP